MGEQTDKRGEICTITTSMRQLISIPVGITKDSGRLWRNDSKLRSKTSPTSLRFINDLQNITATQRKHLEIHITPRWTALRDSILLNHSSKMKLDKIEREISNWDNVNV